MRTTPDMLRVLRLVVSDLQGRVEAGKLAIIEQAMNHIWEQRAIIEEAEKALPADLRTHRKLRGHISRVLSDQPSEAQRPGKPAERREK